MGYCEECGKPIEPGLLFCEFCGAKIEDPALLMTGKEISEYGIVYTNLPRLSEHLNIPVSTIVNSVDGFINNARQRGVTYELVDVSDSIPFLGSVESHIREIKKIVQQKHPKYLFIIGSSNVIPSIQWANKACDYESDPEVSSDLPYATLDTNSPFDGQMYNFKENSLRVGRLPNIDFDTYFDNITYRNHSTEEVNKFAETAKVWDKETKDICSKYGGKKNILTSPDHEIYSTMEMLPTNTDLMFFNLHGSNLTQFWYGQEGASYPETVAPFTFKDLYRPYFLAVSACYGAAYEDRSEDESILLSALSGKCISFLGSSCIAFGTNEPPGSCADVIAEEYLKNLCNGVSAGDSLAFARDVLSKGSEPEEIKTLAEFSLYGDPSLRLLEPPSSTKKLFRKTIDIPFDEGIDVPIPNTRRAVSLELCTINTKIVKSIDDIINDKYSDFKGITPKYMKNNNNTDLYYAVYSKSFGFGKRIISISFDSKGKVKSVLHSK